MTRRRMLYSAIVFCGCIAAPAWAAEPNSLTEKEKRAGFELLFNGHDLHGWEPEKGPWKVQDGVIYFPAADASDGRNLAYTLKAIPADFELRFEWKEAPPGAPVFQGNFGIGTFGHMTQDGWAGRFCCEYLAGERSVQLFTDEASVPVKFNGISTNVPPTRDARRRAGQWNEARMVCKGPLIQHWLNGEKIVEVDLRHGNWLKLEKELGNPVLDQWFKVKTRGFCLELETTGVAAWYRGLKVRAIAEEGRALVPAVSRSRDVSKNTASAKPWGTRP